MASAISCLAHEDSHLPHFPSTSYTLAETFGNGNFEASPALFPLDFQPIHEIKFKEQDLVAAVQTQKSFSCLPFNGGTIEFICKNNKIVIPKPLRLQITAIYEGIYLI